KYSVCQTGLKYILAKASRNHFPIRLVRNSYFHKMTARMSSKDGTSNINATKETLNLKNPRNFLRANTIIMFARNINPMATSDAISLSSVVLTLYILQIRHCIRTQIVLDFKQLYFIIA